MLLRPRSIIAAVSMALSAAFLLCGYELLRSTSYTLYEKAYSADALPRVMAASPVAVLLVTYLYGRMVSWLGPRRTLLCTTLLSGLGIAVCTVATQAGHRAVFSLYLVREAYIVLIIEQYWSFLNSTVNEGEARLLYGAIPGIASLGSIAGGLLAGRFAVGLGTLPLVYFAAASTIPAALISDLGFHLVGEPQPEVRLEKQSHTPVSDLGLRQFAKTPVLVFILLVVVATQVVAGALEIHWRHVLEAQFPNGDQRTAFTGNLYALLNTAAAVCQFALAPLMLRFLPLRMVHIAVPGANVVACLVGLARPSAWAVSAAYVLFKALDYSVFKAAKEILYIPLPFAARYRAKEVVDVFGYRLSKGGVSLVIEFFRTGGWAYDAALTPAAVIAALIWLGLAVPLTRKPAPPEPEPPVPDTPPTPTI